jgi:hypothetical protein
VFASVNGGLATHDGIAQLTTSPDVYNMLNMTSGFLLRINEAISGVGGDKGRDAYTVLDPPAYDSLWSSINTLATAHFDSHVGVMPTTTHYDHTYFGWAPSGTSQWMSTIGVEVMQSGVNIVNCGKLPNGVSNWAQRMRFGAFTFNKNTYSQNNYGTYFNFSPQNDDIGAHTHFARTLTPLWYVQATKPIDGTALTFRHHNIDLGSQTVSGLIVSAASPDGPWVQRGFWDSTTPRTSSAGPNAASNYKHIVVETQLSPGTGNWEDLHFPENLAGTTTLWQVCEKLQAEVNALKTHNARLALLEHFVDDAWRQKSGGTGQRDQLTEWTEFSY